MEEDIKRDPGDELLDTTNNFRMDLANMLMTNIKSNPNKINPKLVEATNGVLDSIDKQVFTKRKNKLEEETQRNDEEVKSLLAELLNRPETHLGELNQANERRGDNININITIPDNLPKPEIVPGHTEVNAQQLSYSEIIDGVKEEPED